MNDIKTAVLQFPGSNSENEALRALQTAGISAETFRWNRPADELKDYAAYIVPGGFSYEDRIRAGVIAAKEPLLEQLSTEAAKGKPVLGICNGAQTLLEAGLLPGLEPGKVEMALAHNYMRRDNEVVRQGHHCSWVNIRFEGEPERTPFTQKLSHHEILPIVISHGEGRFISCDETVLQALDEKKLVLWRYCDDQGETSSDFPVNPNGSYANIAGICNPQGNVAALMPHPERSNFLRMVPSAWQGEWGNKRRGLNGDSSLFDAPGPGHAIFASLAEYLGVDAETAKVD
jgi:phosphoribosylformylglycinamidine synthase